MLRLQSPKRRRRVVPYALRTRKSKTVKERAPLYKTRKRKRSAIYRPKLVPLKPDEWEKYRGETIAYTDDKILAHGKNLDQVLEEVWEKYGKKPSEVVLHVVSPYPRMIR